MCGILGMLAFEAGKDFKEELRQEAMIFLSSELLQLTQPRGKDATGISTLFSDCDYMGLKMGIPSADFVSRFGGTEKDFDGYLNIWRNKKSPARMVVGHCRKSSVGNSDDNVNNHPIKVEDIIGVHNGTLTNHDKIFEHLDCKRDGKVDSEAIFRLLHHYTKNGTEPFTTEAVLEVCKRLTGSYSCLSFSGNNPYQMVGFRDARPMELLLVKPLKLLLITSDSEFSKHAIFRYNKMANLYQSGDIKFPPLKKTDVELKTLPDDHLYIFDSRKEVDADSKLDDLFITKKILRTNKIWNSKTTTANTNYNTNRHYNSYHAGNTDSKETPANAPAKTIKRTTVIHESGKATRVGMAWNKASHSYKEVGGVEDTEKHASVEINTETGTVIDIETQRVLIVDKDADKNQVYSKFDLIKTHTNIDGLVTDPVKINVIDIDKTKSRGECMIPSEITEVDMIIHPEVLEKAEQALLLEENFSNDVDVQLALSIDSRDNLLSLPVYSLANRIKKYLYKKGWYNGYTACLKESETADKLQKMAKTSVKQKSAERNIRVMKGIVRVFDNIIPTNQIMDHTIAAAVENVVDKNKELNVENIKEVFKPGDLRTIPSLRKVMNSMVIDKK